MAKRPVDTPPLPAARLDGDAAANRGAPPRGGGSNEPGPILSAGWKLFGPMSRLKTYAILAIGAWIVLVLVVLGVFALFN